MKTFKELAELPIDHLLALIVVISSLIFVAMKWKFDSVPREESEPRYYADVPKRRLHKTVIVVFFVLGFMALTFGVLWFLDACIAKGKR